ncbi:hypothetical protein [Enterobacter ludwigii]|uniref:hypothetical protein n=1 Tax=Enterobacter ludwigii TaxID=299767 RepID=UPI002A80E519|nr:hypothetical protein [Enterobacter ludwigii]
MKLFEMEGFLRGKCFPGDMKVNETNAEYLVRKFTELEQKLIESERYGRQTDITIDNLEMKLAQMAAELASVKQQEPKAWFIRITDEVTVDAREGEKWRGVPLVRVDVETPNHDAFLAEVRAQGADECVRKLVTSDDDDFSDAPNICAMVAYQIRKGVQS